MSNFEGNPLTPTPMDNLQRFLDGQRFGYETALKEMKAGEKRNHWIWYIFPQIKGLGHSPNSQTYGISGLDEAKAYLEPYIESSVGNSLKAYLLLGRPVQEWLGSIAIDNENNKLIIKH